MKSIEKKNELNWLLKEWTKSSTFIVYNKHTWNAVKMKKKKRKVFHYFIYNNDNDENNGDDNDEDKYR